MTQRPNLIICMCDELRAFELGCYGHPHIRTPHLDALAERGTRFEVAVTNEPVCMAARSMLISGQYARTCTGQLGNAGWPGGTRFGDAGFPQWPTGDRVGFPDRTLPECLQDAGYHTRAIGKWHIEAWPDRIGFDRYLIPAHHHAHEAQWFIEDGSRPFSAPGYSVEFEAERVRGFLRERAGGEEPFFLYYNLSPPHMPLDEAPDRYKNLYSRDQVVTRPNVTIDTTTERFREQMKTYLWDYRYYRDHLPHTRELPEGMDLERLTAMYMGLTTWVDDMVGSVLRTLRETGLDENTLVVFTSDHGDNLGSHGLMGKSHLNEESIRIPFLVAGPGIARQEVTTQVASLLDIAPTFLTAAGTEAPPWMAGQDLGPVLRGDRKALERAYAFIETTADGCGIRTPTHTFGLPWAGDRTLGERAHYATDLRQDPFQLRKVNPGQTQLMETLEPVLRNWHTQTPWCSK
jgi:choline-sulfatase